MDFYIWGEVWNEVNFFISVQLFWYHLLKRLFSSLNCLSIFVKNQLSIYVGLFLDSLFFFLCAVCLYLCQYYAALIVAIKEVFKSGSIRPPTFFFFLKLFWLHRLSVFPVNFKIILSISTKISVGILTWIDQMWNW